MVKKDEKKCVDCGECIEVCPMDCHGSEDFSACSECGICVDECPVGALSIDDEGE